MFAVDIVAFGARSDDIQAHLRETLHRITESACNASGLPWSICHHEDRGDGLFLITPACVPAEILFDHLVPRIGAGIRRHNRLSATDTQIQLKMAIHAGHIRFDAHGATGTALIFLFRLLDAPEFKTAINNTGTEFAVMTSTYLYEEIIQHGLRLIDPHTYRKITITTKEGLTPALLWLHPSTPQRHPRPATSPRSGLTRQDVDIAALIASGQPRQQITR